jgi:pyruvate/2-oxoglutarate dehydrogenase complex dihydrolipoamide acyltransferase (E2) component
VIEDVPLARLGDTVDQVVVLEWYVAAGARVEVGDRLLLVETDKVEVEVESPFAGEVAACHVDVGDEVATGAVLCTIDTATG